MKAFAQKIFGSVNDRKLKPLRRRVQKINTLEPMIEALSDQALRAKTDEFRKRLADGASLDDILDEGHTLAGLLNYCQIQQPASLKTAVLVHKQHDRGVSPQLDYCGLAVPDQYVFGCGMDYKGYWRNISAIYAVSTIPKT